MKSEIEKYNIYYIDKQYMNCLKTFKNIYIYIFNILQ